MPSVLRPNLKFLVSPAKSLNPLSGGLTLNITRVVSSNLIPQCSVYGAFIQILVVTAVEDAVIRACMYLLNL
jgi:hypothetical protein